jgi:hypothetical protein
MGLLATALLQVNPIGAAARGISTLQYALKGASTAPGVEANPLPPSDSRPSGKPGVDLSVKKTNPNAEPTESQPAALQTEPPVTTTSVPRDAVGTIRTKVHCVCGPAGVPSNEYGCIPVVANAVAQVQPKKVVTFFSFSDPSSDGSPLAASKQEVNRLHHEFTECRRKSYFPISPLYFEFQSANVAEHTNPANVGSASIVDEIVFLMVRWNGWVPFHNLFDHGLFQVWMGWLTVSDYAKKELGLTGLASSPGVHIVDDLVNWIPNPLPAIHELWLIVLKPLYFYWQKKELTAKRLYVVGDLPLSTSGYNKMRHDFNSPQILEYLRNMSLIIQEGLLSRYGDAPVNNEAPVFLEDRPVTNTFDAELRTRGVQPHLRAEFQQTLEPIVGKMVTRKPEWWIPMKEQFHWIRQSKVIITGEGSFMAFMHLSAPGTTWICVYNHTRPPDFWMYTNWHAPGALAFTWMRVVFYMIDNGIRAPMTEVAEFFRAPFKPGVYYLGADETGHRRPPTPAPPPTPQPPSTPTPVTKAPVVPPPRYRSAVHCVCGPIGIVREEEKSCVPLLENVTTDVLPKTLVTFHLDVESEEEKESLKRSFEDCMKRGVYIVPEAKFEFKVLSKEVRASCPNTDEELQFLTWRWGGWTPYHLTYDHGLFQVRLATMQLLQFARERRGLPPPSPASGSLPVDTSSEQPRDKPLYQSASYHVVLDLVWGGDPNYQGRTPDRLPPIYEWWDIVLKPLRPFYWQKKERSCHRFYTTGDFDTSPGRTRHRRDWDFLSPEMNQHIADLGKEIVAGLIQRYGDAPTNDKEPILFEDRQTTNVFDHDFRTRGIQPALKAEFLEALEPVLGGKARTKSFHDGVSMKDQFHWIRQSRVILAGEGAFFASMHLSAPNTTWICVYNHTMPNRGWIKFTNYHATTANALPWMRLILYVIDHGKRAPVREVADILSKPFVPGVVFIGSDKYANAP